MPRRGSWVQIPFSAPFIFLIFIFYFLLFFYSYSIDNPSSLQSWIFDKEPFTDHNKDAVFIVYNDTNTKNYFQSHLKTTYLPTYKEFHTFFKYRLITQKRFRKEYWRLPIRFCNKKHVQFFIFTADGVFLLDEIYSKQDFSTATLLFKYRTLKKKYETDKINNTNLFFWKLQRLKSNL